MSFDLLPAAIKVLSKRIPKVVALATNRVAYEMHESIIDSTRVDTSKAISNWQVSVGIGNSSYIPAHVEGKAGSTWATSRHTSLTKGGQAVKGRKVGTDIHIVNNAPYIEKIEDAPGYESVAALAFRVQVAATNLRLS